MEVLKRTAEPLALGYENRVVYITWEDGANHNRLNYRDKDFNIIHTKGEGLAQMASYEAFMDWAASVTRYWEPSLQQTVDEGL